MYKRSVGAIVLCWILLVFSLGTIADTWNYKGSGWLVIGPQAADFWKIDFSLMNAEAWFNFEGPAILHAAMLFGDLISGSYDVDAFTLGLELFLQGDGSGANITSEWPNLEELIGRGFQTLIYSGDELELTWEEDFSEFMEQLALYDGEDNTTAFIVINAEWFWLSVTNNLKKLKGPKLEFVSLEVNAVAARLVVRNVGDVKLVGKPVIRVAPTFEPWHWHPSSLWYQSIESDYNPGVISPGEYAVFEFKIPSIPESILESFEKNRQFWKQSAECSGNTTLARIMEGSSLCFQLAIGNQRIWAYSPPLLSDFVSMPDD